MVITVRKTAEFACKGHGVPETAIIAFFCHTRALMSLRVNNLFGYALFNKVPFEENKDLYLFSDLHGVPETAIIAFFCHTRALMSLRVNNLFGYALFNKVPFEENKDLYLFSLFILPHHTVIHLPAWLQIIF